MYQIFTVNINAQMSNNDRTKNIAMLKLLDKP